MCYASCTLVQAHVSPAGLAAPAAKPASVAAASVGVIRFIPLICSLDCQHKPTSLFILALTFRPVRQVRVGLPSRMHLHRQPSPHQHRLLHSHRVAGLRLAHRHPHRQHMHRLSHSRSLQADGMPLTLLLLALTLCSLNPNCNPSSNHSHKALCNGVRLTASLHALPLPPCSHQSPQ